MTSHLFDTNQDPENVPDVVFVCTICYQYFTDKIQLTNHNQSHHAAAKSKQGNFVHLQVDNVINVNLKEITK